MNFTGVCKKCELNTPAAEILGPVHINNKPIVIEEDSTGKTTVTVDGQLWTDDARHHPEDDDKVISGQIASDPNCYFVICKGSRKIVGIIYEKFLSCDGGEDPDSGGSWEAEEGVGCEQG